MQARARARALTPLTRAAVASAALPVACAARTRGVHPLTRAGARACGAAGQVMEERLHFAPVQVIGTECIMCSAVIGVGATVLVHAKVGLMNGSAVEVTVRTKDNRMGEGVQRLCTQVLAS